MAPLNNDGVVYHGRDLIQRIELLDSEIKGIGDELSLEGHYIEDELFPTNYENSLESVISILEGEKSRLETIARAYRAA